MIQETRNTIELKDLTSETDYEVDVKISLGEDQMSKKSATFTTKAHASISDLEIKNITLDSADIKFNANLGFKEAYTFEYRIDQDS